MLQLYNKKSLALLVKENVAYFRFVFSASIPRNLLMIYL